MSGPPVVGLFRWLYSEMLLIECSACFVSVLQVGMLDGIPGLIKDDPEPFFTWLFFFLRYSYS